MPSRAKQGLAFTLPAMPRLDLPSVPELGGGPRRERYRLRPATPYPPQPPGFLNSLAEWVVMWWLTEGRATIGQPTLQRVGPAQEPERGRTFFYQVRVPVLGVFAQTEETRVDFLIPGYGGAGYEGLCLDPYNTFTHPDPAHDLLKRQVLADQANLQLIWILTDRLEGGDFDVIEQALAGHDESPRSLFGV